MGVSNPSVAAAPSPNQSEKSYPLALALVTSLFFMWGLSYGLLDVLNKHFQETLSVSHAKSGLLQASYFGAYFLWAMPAAKLMEKAGYKFGILLGLSMYAIGALLFIPATQASSYGMFLFALFVIASGLGCLETAANPYVTVLGPHQTSARRLNLSQSFNGLGQFVGPLIGGMFFFQSGAADNGSAQSSVQTVYAVIAGLVVVVALAFWRTPLPDIRERDPHGSEGPATPLLKQRHFVNGIITQFFYVAAQVGVGAFFINFMTEHSDGIDSKRAAFLLSVGMVLLLAGRFSGTALMSRFAAGKMLGLYGAINVVLVLTAIVAPPMIAIGAMLGVFFFMSIMFPTIFALGVKDLGANTKRGASFQIMAIVGGAIMPYVMGAVSDKYNVGIAFLIPAACFAVVCWYGFVGSRIVPAR